MKWKDSDEVLDTGEEEEAGGAYEEDYSPLGSRKSGLGAKLASAIALPGIWKIVVVAVLLLFIILLFFPKGRDNGQLAGLDQRLQYIESKMASMEKQFESLDDRIKALKNPTGPMLVRLDRMESKFGKQLSEFHRQLKQLKSLQSRQRTTPDPKKASSKKSTQKTVKTFVVRKGDTLYSISKQFGLSVAQLRKLNKLSSKETIFPGQKLTVK